VPGVLFAIALLVVGALAYSGTSEEQRAQLIRALRKASARPRAVAARNRLECDPFLDVLRARTRFAVVTPILIALNVIVFVSMIFGRGSLADPETLVAWGANFGPRTTNGEWWRLVTAPFVHAGLLPLVVNLTALAQLGLILERIVGRRALAAVYVAAGVLAGLVSIAAHPVVVSAGASAAIASLYGLLIACGVWDLFRPTETPIPLAAGKRLAPAAALFLVYNTFDGGIELKAEFLSFVAGLVAGLVLTSRVGDRRPERRVFGAVTAAMAALAIVVAVPLRGIADVRPEIARVLDIEGRTVPVYRAAEARSSKGQTSATSLADLIEQKIMPELQAARDRLAALRGVPQEHRHFVADAAEYLKLRHESWRLRAEGLRRIAKPLRRDQASAGLLESTWRARAETEHRVTQVMLGRAEGTERASLEALQRLKPPAPSTPASP
jgi:membrane associated rhomboid family serine protease